MDRPSGVATTLLALAHPFVFAAGVVLDRFALTPSSLVELPRPLLVALALTGAVLLLWWVILRSLPWAGLLASGTMLAVLFQPVVALVVGGVIAWWLLVRILRRARGSLEPELGATSLPVLILNAYAAILLVAALWSAGPALVPGLTSEIGLPEVTEGPVPNVYVLILDGYPRSDTLADAFAFDNGPFERELGRLGFRVAPDAASNYNKTWLSVASLLSGQYVHDLAELADPPPTNPEQARLGEELVNAGPVLQAYRDLGHEIVSIVSPVPTTDVTRDARVRMSGHLTSFEIALVTASLPARLFPDSVLGMLTEDARAYLDAQLDALDEEAHRGRGSSRFVVTHLMSPHPPFVLGQEPDYLAGCFPVCKVWETTVEETGMTDAAYAERMRTQVAALNDRVVETLSSVVEADPDATIILLSDHGARHDPADRDEHFRIFFAARAGALDAEFPDDISPVNVFRRLLSVAGAATLADVPHESIASDWYLPLTLDRGP